MFWWRDFVSGPLVVERALGSAFCDDVVGSVSGADVKDLTGNNRLS